MFKKIISFVFVLGMFLMSVGCAPTNPLVNPSPNESVHPTERSGTILEKWHEKSETVSYVTKELTGEMQQYLFSLFHFQKDGKYSSDEAHTQGILSDVGMVTVFKDKTRRVELNVESKRRTPADDVTVTLYFLPDGKILQNKSGTLYSITLKEVKEISPCLEIFSVWDFPEQTDKSDYRPGELETTEDETHIQESVVIEKDLLFRSYHKRTIDFESYELSFAKKNPQTGLYDGIFVDDKPFSLFNESEELQKRFQSLEQSVSNP